MWWKNNIHLTVHFKINGSYRLKIYIAIWVIGSGMPYNFAVLNSLVTGHLGKMIISPNWWNQFWWNLWCWIRDMRGYLSAKFQIQRSNNVGDITETVTSISAEEIGKLGLLVPGASLHCFQKRSTLDSSIWRDIYVYPIRSKIFQVFKIRVSVTNPRSASSRTRTGTSKKKMVRSNLFLFPFEVLISKWSITSSWW